MWWLLSARYLVVAALFAVAVIILWAAVTNRE
jgi:hypothetical protein